MIAVELKSIFNQTANDPAVSAVHHHAKALETILLNLSMHGDDETPAGYQAKNRSRIGQGTYRNRRDKGATDELFLQSLINQKTHALEERIEWLDIRILQLQSDIKLTEERLARSKERVVGINQALMELDENGDLARNETGGIENNAAVEALHAYKNRTGLSIVETDVDALNDVLRAQRKIELAEQTRLQSEIDQDRQVQQTYEVERDNKAMNLAALKRHDPEAVAELAEAHGLTEENSQSSAALFNRIANQSPKKPAERQSPDEVVQEDSKVEQITAPGILPPAP